MPRLRDDAYASPQPKRTLDIDCFLYNPYPEPTSDKSETGIKNQSFAIDARRHKPG
ncbi:TPA: hypothetical protein ACGNRN_002951 [Legionella pneumophila]